MMLLLASLAGLCLCNEFRVMTFNTWLSGGEVSNGLAKIAKHITLVNPDVVSLQEIESLDIARNLTDMLPGKWMSAFKDIPYPDTMILTRHKIVPTSFSFTRTSTHVLIETDQGMLVHFWAVHTDWKGYGPYAANNKLVSHSEQILAGESPKSREGRKENIMEIAESQAMLDAIVTSKTVPIIVAGDFNSPSHQDWIRNNINIHGGWEIKWPATSILTEQLNMRDSFRELHPDPIKVPGVTWSTCNKYNAEWDYAIEEPQDRIDFIFYRGPLVPISSRVYSGTGPITPIPHQWENDWPSDHYAVITDFRMRKMGQNGDLFYEIFL